MRQLNFSMIYLECNIFSEFHHNTKRYFTLNPIHDVDHIIDKTH